MKKSYLLIGLLSLLFFWFGHVVFAQNCDYAMCVQNANEDKAMCNATPWFNAAACNSEYSAAFSACSQCAGSPSINQCGGPCPAWQTCQLEAWSDSQFSCQGTSTPFTPPTPTPTPTPSSVDEQVSQFNATCGVTSITPSNLTYVENINGVCCVEPAGSWLNTGLSVCTTAQTMAAGSSVPCNIPTSNLNWVANAYVTSLGVSCECQKWYGELYNSANGKTTCELCSRSDVCCGVKLNTTIPFIGNCIETTAQDPTSTINETTAFPTLVTALVKILVSVILIASFIMIVAGGVMWATGDAKWGKDMIVKVAIGLAVLGASGVILRLVNPNFFG